MKSKDGKCTISLTPSGSFKVRFYDEFNNRRSKNIKTATERDYMVRAIKRFEDLDQWFPPEAGGHIHRVKTFQDLIERFLEQRRTVHEVSESCLGNYRAQLVFHILPVLGKIELKDLNLRDIERLASKLKTTRPKTRGYKAIRRNDFHQEEEFLSAHYRREILILTCSIAKFGFDREYLPTHPFKAFILPEPGDRPYDYWRLEEEDKFLDWLQSGGKYVKAHSNCVGGKYQRHWSVWNHAKIYEVVLLALRTGMRKGEITALSMDNVDFDKGVITIQDAWSEKSKKFRNKTKNGGYRRIEMNADVRGILEKYRGAPKDAKIFAKIMLSHTIKYFSKLTRLAGVREIHFHALRHTFLTNIANGIGIDKPVDILKVKELAGHSDIQTTMVYIHKIGIQDTSSLQWSREERARRSTE